MITGQVNEHIVIDSLLEGACDFIYKPFKTDILAHTGKKCAERHGLIKENERYKQHL